MTHGIHSLNAHPHADWKCLDCREQGNAFDLITHTGCNEKHIFHRTCYPNSSSAIVGICQKCQVPLHKSRIYYVVSDADMYRLRDHAHFFRLARKVLDKGESFDKKYRGMALMARFPIDEKKTVSRSPALACLIRRVSNSAPSGVVFRILSSKISPRIRWLGCKTLEALALSGFATRCCKSKPSTSKGDLASASFQGSFSNWVGNAAR